MYPYEGLFLLDPVAHTADAEAVEKTATDLIKKHGGEIVKVDRWEERRLAYEIKGHRRGIYLLTYFNMPGEGIDTMRRETRITETILRQLVIRLPWDIETYLEKSNAYQEKMREEQEGRRDHRDRDDSAPPRAPAAPAPAEAAAPAPAAPAAPAPAEAAAPAPAEEAAEAPAEETAEETAEAPAKPDTDKPADSEETGG